MSELRIQVTGTDQALRRLASMNGAIPQAIGRALARSGEKIVGRARLKVSGQVLRLRTGRLRSSIQKIVSADGSELRVGPNVIYGRIHELGGQTPPHTILPIRRRALRFVTPGFVGPPRLTKGGLLARRQSAGTFTFARRVNHPGSLIPARPYLAPSLEESKPDIQADLRDELGKLLNEGGK